MILILASLGLNPHHSTRSQGTEPRSQLWGLCQLEGKGISGEQEASPPSIKAPTVQSLADSMRLGWLLKEAQQSKYSLAED